MDILSFILGYTKGKSQGGGGSIDIPYLKPYGTAKYRSANQSGLGFMYQGELYRRSRSASSSSASYYIEKFNKTTKTFDVINTKTYTEVSSDETIQAYFRQFVGCCEHNGLLYFITSSSNYMMSFDGTTFTYIGDSPASEYYLKGLYEFGGTLYALVSDTSARDSYVFDDSTQTWSVTDKISLVGVAGYFFCNNKFYYNKGADTPLLAFDGNTTETIYNTSPALGVGFAVIDNVVYRSGYASCGNTYKATLHKYDLATNEVTNIGNTPAIGTSSWIAINIFYYDDKFIVWDTLSTEMYEIILPA